MGSVSLRFPCHSPVRIRADIVIETQSNRQVIRKTTLHVIQPGYRATHRHCPRNNLARVSSLSTLRALSLSGYNRDYRGIEELVTDTDWERSSYSFGIGIPILLGFTLMFLLEEYTNSHEQPLACSSTEDSLTFDVDLEERGRPSNPESPALRHVETSSIQRTYPLSFGLIIHALVDGYALGVSASNVHSPNLSLVVFLAIIVHKGMMLCFCCFVS